MAGKKQGTKKGSKKTAKKGGAKKSGTKPAKRTAKQLAAAKKNIKKAQRAAAKARKCKKAPKTKACGGPGVRKPKKGGAKRTAKKGSAKKSAKKGVKKGGAKRAAKKAPHSEKGEGKALSSLKTRVTKVEKHVKAHDVKIGHLEERMTLTQIRAGAMAGLLAPSLKDAPAKLRDAVSHPSKLLKGSKAKRASVNAKAAANPDGPGWLSK